MTERFYHQRRGRGDPAAIKARVAIIKQEIKDATKIPLELTVEEIRRFVEAIRKGKSSPVPGEQALVTQRVLDGIYKSAVKGKEVTV